MYFTKKSGLISLGVLLGLSFLVLSITNHFVLTINFFNDSRAYLTGNPAGEQTIYESMQKYLYLSTAIYISFKMFFISLILYTALYLFEKPVRYTPILNIVIFSESIFILQAISKIIWFRYEYPHGTLSDWNRVQVFSLISLVGDVPADWFYLFQTLNVFEVAYWFILAYGIKAISGYNYDKSLRIVIVSYLPALFIWVCLVSFMTVMLTPWNA